MIAAIVGFYLVAMVAVGLYLRSRIQSTTDFLLAGRQLGLILTTATLAAVQLGAGVILGGAETAAESGMWPGTWYGLGCGGGLILAGFLVASRLRRRGAYVPMDFFGERYGERKWIRFWAWLSNIPSLIGVLAAQLMASGSIFTLFGASYRQGVWLSGGVIMFYSVVAGMWGAVVTDLLQLIIIWVGIPLVTLTVAARLGELGSQATLMDISSTHFIPEGMASRAVFLILPFFLSISVSYDAYMRFQSAKSETVAKWGSILAGFLVIGMSLCVGLVGAAGRLLYPELENGAVFPHMIQDTLSPLLAGLVISALLAAAMSSANCLLLSLAGCFTRDLYNKVLYPSREIDELKHSRHVSRIVIVGAVVIGIGIALHAEGILYTMILFNYPYMGSMLIPLLGGVLWRGATHQGAIAAILVGGTIGVVSFSAGVPGPFNGLLNVDLGLIMAWLVSAVVFVAVSLASSSSRS